MVKDELEELIAGYKDDFFEKTGVTLYCTIETGLKKISLERLVRSAEKFYNIDKGTLTLPNRVRKCVIAKKAICHLGTDMGYTRAGIASVLNLDHTTITHHLQESRNEFKTESEYRDDFMKFQEFLRKNY